MGRKSNKSKEKRLKRREENALFAMSKAKVDAANALEDPMAELKVFKKFDRNGLDLTLSCDRVGSVDKDTLDWAFQLTKTNMQFIYEESGWGWNDKQKREEMTDDSAWYIIARDQDNKAVAAVHFRFDVDEEQEVLYCYEIQLSKEVRRKGLGKFLMQVLELIGHKTEMQKVMLTVFKENKPGQEFFKNKCKYTIDETSPENTFAEAMFDEEDYTYEILSKPIGVKKAEGKSAVQNGTSTKAEEKSVVQNGTSTQVATNS